MEDNSLSIKNRCKINKELDLNMKEKEWANQNSQFECIYCSGFPLITDFSIFGRKLLYVQVGRRFLAFRENAIRDSLIWEIWQMEQLLNKVGAHTLIL